MTEPAEPVLNLRLPGQLQPPPAVCLWLVAGGWWLPAGGWWLVAGGWWLVAGGWWLVAAAGWRGGGWQLVVIGRDTGAGGGALSPADQITQPRPCLFQRLRPTSPPVKVPALCSAARVRITRAVQTLGRRRRCREMLGFTMLTVPFGRSGRARCGAT